MSCCAALSTPLDGQRVVESLLKHRSLWEAVMLDRFCFSNPGNLPTIGLIKLRDLPHGYWNADSLYFLTTSVDNARRLDGCSLCVALIMQQF